MEGAEERYEIMRKFKTKRKAPETTSGTLYLLCN